MTPFLHRARTLWRNPAGGGGSACPQWAIFGGGRGAAAIAGAGALPRSAALRSHEPAWLVADGTAAATRLSRSYANPPANR